MKNLQKSLLSGLVALTLNAPASAQGRDIQDRVFESAYFEAFAPRTALDMLGRVPGFQLTREDSKRGLGNGGSNVLINGERVAGKTNPRDQLSRIIAPSVVRIEIVDGTSLDIPGLSGQVANVITKPTKFSGTWAWRGEARRDLKNKFLDGEITVSGKIGKLDYSAKLENDTFRNGHIGPEILFTPDGTIFETRDENGKFAGKTPSLSGNLTWKPKDDHVLNLNAEYQLFDFKGSEISKRTALTPHGETLETRFSREENEWNAEVGGDYEFPAGSDALNGKLKFIGYYRTEHSPTVARFDVFDPVLGHTEGSRFFRVADEAETIFRSEYSWNRTEGQSWQLGLEGAFNYLDIDSSLLLLDIGGVYVDDPLDEPKSRVEEKRAEATLTHSRTLSPKWDIQVSGGAEFSEISQTGATNKIREFIRPKGFISTTYKPNDTLSIRAKLERQVGQLDFFDFISSVSLQDNFNTDGNDDLVPEQTWFGEVEFDKKIRNGVTVKTRFYGELISDLVDRIPIIKSDGSIGDAIGNIDSGAKRYGVEINSTIKGDPFGYKGMLLNLRLQLQDSSVDDPLTQISRHLNRDLASYWRFDFRHDLPDTNWAWGLFMEQDSRSSTYRLSTINTFKFNGPWGSAFIEHKDVFGMKVRVQAANLFNATDDFRREIFANNRDSGVLDYTEERSRAFGVFGRLTISGSF